MNRIYTLREKIHKLNKKKHCKVLFPLQVKMKKADAKNIIIYYKYLL